jgi:hypothetical protein
MIVIILILSIIEYLLVSFLDDHDNLMHAIHRVNFIKNIEYNILA